MKMHIERHIKIFIFLAVLLFLLLFNILPVYAQSLIVVSGYPLFSLVKSLFPQAKIYSILPPRGDFHHHELRPKDLENIKQADLVLLVGSEPWAKRVFKLKPKGILSLAKPDEKLPDTHVWFKLERIERLLEELSGFADKSNVESLLAELKGLKAERESLAVCQNKVFYHLGHKVFYYLIEGSGVEEVPLVKGHHHGEISPGSLMKFLKEMEAKNVKRVVLSSSEFIRYEKYFKSKGYEIIRAYSGDEPINMSYPEFIRHNILAIKKALHCEK